MEISQNFAFENVLLNLNIFFGWGGGGGLLSLRQIYIFEIRIHFKFDTKCDLFTTKIFHTSDGPLFILIKTKQQICTKTCSKYRKMHFLKFLEICCKSRKVLLICQNQLILMSIRQAEKSLPKNCSYLSIHTVP
jgi:hypothetical protein